MRGDDPMLVENEPSQIERRGPAMSDGDNGPRSGGVADNLVTHRSAPRRLKPMLPLPLTLAVLGLTYWCVDIASPTLPVIQTDLGLSGAGTGLLMSIFFFGRLLTNVPAAWLIERIGPRGCALIGAIVLGLASAGAALAPAELPLLVARGLQGGGVALLATAGLLSVLRARPGDGAAMTAFNVAAGVGGSFGLFTGGLVTTELGWRSVFWLCAGLALVMLLGTLLARTARAGRRSDDQALTGEAEPPAPPAMSRGLFAALAANLLVYGNYGIWVVALALFAAGRFGAGPAELGTLLLVVNLIHLLAALPVGRAIRRVGAAPALAVGFAVAAAGIGAALLTPSFGWLLPPMALYAVGQITSNSAAGDLVLRLGGGGGRAVGLLRFTSDVGLVVGPLLIGLLADLAGVGAPFLVLCGLTATGAITTWWLGRRSHRGQVTMP
ncbi:MAG: MFS transporter [Chloroflexota bacterium]|nr:MFS transporter [Chloroflexota bacterium]